MQMIRQDHPGEQYEGPCRLRRAEGSAQQVDMLHQQPAPPFEQVDGEEIRAAQHACASIVGHAHSVQNPATAGHRPKARIGIGKRRLVAGRRTPMAGQGPPYKAFGDNALGRA